MNGYAAAEIQANLGQVVAIDTPAAGSELAYKYGQNEFWKPRCLSFQVVTSATVANRLVHLDLLDGAGNIIGRFSSGFTQSASLTTVYTFGVDLNVYGANAAASLGAPIPDLWLHPGCSLAIGVANIDTTDQISAVNLTVDQVFAGSYPDE